MSSVGGVSFLCCCDHTLGFLMQFYILVFFTKYYMWLLQIFAKVLYTGSNVLLCCVYRNLRNLLSITGNLRDFQTFSIVNNAVMNNFVNKMFLCISKYSLRLVS